MFVWAWLLPPILAAFDLDVNLVQGALIFLEPVERALQRLFFYLHTLLFLPKTFTSIYVFLIGMTVRNSW